MKAGTQIILAGIAALMLAFLSVGTTSVHASTQNCVQLGTFHDYACAYHEPGTGGGVYLDDVLFVNWYYWHPATGDMVVEETYVKSAAPGFNPAAGHRKISFADGHVIADSAWLANFPNNTSSPLTCAQPDTQMIGGCTAAEQKSAMDFQHAMATDNPSHSF